MTNTQTHKRKTLPAEAVATGFAVTPAQYGELASLTTYFCGGVLWDHRVSGELWVEDAAVRVSVHGQTVQQLTVLLHTLVERRVCIRNQLRHRVCG